MSPRFGDTYRRTLREAIEAKELIEQAAVKLAPQFSGHDTTDPAQLKEFYDSRPGQFQADLRAVGLDPDSLAKAKAAQDAFAPSRLGDPRELLYAGVNPRRR